MVKKKLTEVSPNIDHRSSSTTHRRCGICRVADQMERKGRFHEIVVGES